MFFLGISAHLFIYLLVPAFLIVCYYFRGTSGSPEAMTLLPEAIVYENHTYHHSEKTYIYKCRQEQQEAPDKIVSIPECDIVSSFVTAYSADYSSPFILSSGLRAPPTL